MYYDDDGWKGFYNKQTKLHFEDAMMYIVHSFLSLTFSITFPFNDALSAQCSPHFLPFCIHELCVVYIGNVYVCVYASECVGKKCITRKKTRCNNIEFMKKHLQWLQNTWNCLHLLCSGKWHRKKNTER